MSETKLENFTKAVARLDEAIERYKTVKESDPLFVAVRDSLVKTYEITFELSWKALADFLESKFVKLEYRVPRVILGEAHTAGYIKNEKLWIEMLENRNKLVHTYNIEFVWELAPIIADRYVAALSDLLKIITEQK